MWFVAALPCGIFARRGELVLPQIHVATPVNAATTVAESRRGSAARLADVVLFFEIIRRAGPVFFAQFNYLAVLAGVAWGAVIFGERLSIYLVLAMVLMFVGVFLSGYRRRPAVAPQSNPAG